MSLRSFHLLLKTARPISDHAGDLRRQPRPLRPNRRAQRNLGDGTVCSCVATRERMIQRSNGVIQSVIWMGWASRSVTTVPTGADRTSELSSYKALLTRLIRLKVNNHPAGNECAETCSRVETPAHGPRGVSAYEIPV